MLLIRSLISRRGILNAPIYSRLTSVFSKSYATTKDNIELDEGPIQYTKSPASKWKASSSRSGIPNPRLWYEPHVIIVSLSIFMIYFCILREENGIDVELGRTLYSRIEGLEEHQLKESLKYNLANGIDASDIIAKLKQFEDARKQSVTGADN